jgi:hypothetical protein
MVMRPLSRAIAGIPRPYLADRSKRLIFSRTGWNVLLAKDFVEAQAACAKGGMRQRLCAPRAVRLASLRITMPEDDVENSPDLSISPEKVCYIIVKAREFDAKDVVTDPDDASNPTDDAMVSVLEDHRDDPVVQEIAAAIFAMSEDERVDLVTLVWLGRGDGSLEDWDELRAEAARSHNKRTASYLLGMPLLPDYLAEGLAQLGYSCDE